MDSRFVKGSYVNLFLGIQASLSVPIPGILVRMDECIVERTIFLSKEMDDELRQIAMHEGISLNTLTVMMCRLGMLTRNFNGRAVIGEDWQNSDFLAYTLAALWQMNHAGYEKYFQWRSGLNLADHGYDKLFWPTDRLGWPNGYDKYDDELEMPK